MTKDRYTVNEDRFALDRFINAQQGVYDRALAEIKNGRKQTHWMWYIFPQLKGLGQSETSKYYAIKSQEEALAYLNHSVLGSRLRESAAAVLTVKERTVSEIFGYPDDLKLKSSMTLFSRVPSDPAVFIRVLDKYFQGEPDAKTLQLLEKL